MTTIDDHGTDHHRTDARSDDGTGPPGMPASVAAVAEPAVQRYESVSVRGPALVVLGIAVLIIVVGVVGSALTSGGSPTLTVRSVTTPAGTLVQLTPATTALKSIVSAAGPPSDIIGDLAVPADSPVTGHINADQGVSQFDRTVEFTSGLPSDQVVDVYRDLLPKLGWKVLFVGSGASRLGDGTEVLAKKGSGDSYYWEVGVVVSPTTSAGSTPFSVEVFQLPDDN
jgi:hypothetical protein